MSNKINSMVEVNTTRGTVSKCHSVLKAENHCSSEMVIDSLPEPRVLGQISSNRLVSSAVKQVFQPTRKQVVASLTFVPLLQTRAYLALLVFIRHRIHNR